MKAIEQYFNYLKEAGADVPSTADSFKKTLSDKNSAEQYYGYLKQNNFDAPDSFDSFAKTLGITKSPTVPVKKKDGSEPLSIDTPSVSGLNQEDPIPSVSALLKQRKKLKAEKSAPKPTSAPGFPLATVETAPTIDYDAEISKIDEQIKSKGYNPRELDIEFSEYDFDLDDNKFGEFYANYKKRPLSTLRDLSSRGWGQAVRGVISRNEDETKRMEDNANFNRLAEVGAKLPKQDLNTAINWGRNAISETIALTAPDGESRDVALNNLKNGFLPVLGQVALRDKNFTSQPNLPLQFGLLSADLFDKNYADDSRAILAQDLSGNPDASQARDRRRYELEQRGLSMMQSAIGEEYEQQSDMLNKWGEWQKNNLDKLGELGQKIAAANPEIKAAVDSANKEIAGINKSIERAGLDLKTQEQIVSEYKEDYESGATSRAVYAAEVKKYNSMVEQYNSSISQAKSNIEQIKKTADEKSASSGVSPDDVKEYNKLYSEYESLSEPRNVADKFNSWASYLSKAQNNLIKNNPTVLADNITMQLQEEDGENVNPAERFMLGFGSLVPKAADAFEIIYDAIALSPDKKREKDYQRLGRSQSDQLLMFYQRQKDRVLQSPIITVVPDSIKKRIADINANNNLNEEEKEEAKKEALRQGFVSGQIYQATNPNAGKINITGKSILNSAVTVIPQILTAAGLSYITGGVGAGVAVSTFLNGYSSYYNDAISKSIANPNQYAFAHSLVDYATEMIGTADLKLIQNALKGNKGVGAKFFKDLTDGEFKSLLAGSKNAFKNTGKAFVKNALINAGETGEEIGAQVGGNIIDQELFGEKKPTTEGITETILTTSLGQMPLTLLGVPLSVNRNNIANKYALYNAATDVNGTMAFLKKELEAGNINSQEYTDRVKLVNDYAKAIKETPATYADGNPMRDDDKAKYAFNQFISNMKADKSPLPPQQKQNVDQVIADAENENDKILSNATNQSQVQEGRTEGDLGQPQGIVQGQPEVGQGAGSQGQTQITPANVGDSNIGGQGQVVAPELSKTESLTPDQIEVTEDATGFADQMASAQASLGSTGVSVTPYTQESYDEIASQGGKFLRAVGNKVLAVLKPNGEMVSLVKDATVKAKGAAQALITKMKDMGGLFMDNYDIYLTPIYQKAGYRVVARVPFDEQYAPEGWNNEDSPLKNKPDVVFMVRNDIAPDQEQSFATYEEAQNYTQGLVDQAVNSGAAKLPTQVTKIDKVLNETIPMATQALEQSGVKFQVVDPATDTEQARAARGNQGLFRSEDGTIIIDKSKLADEIEAGIVVWHEASHPVMNIIRNSDKPLYDAVVRGLKQAAKKNKGVAGALNWAQSQEQYDNEDTQNDEAVVETIGRINAGLIDINSLDTGLRQKLIDFINSIAKYFGIDPILNDRDIAAFKKTVSEVADALKTGRNISEIVGKENVGDFQNNRTQTRAVTIAKGTESMRKYGLKEGKNTTRKIGEALERRTREKLGIIGREDRSESAMKKISSYMADEVRYFIEQFGENSGKGWYGEKFQKGIDAMSKIFPEFETDQNARDLFTMLVAVTSDGTEVMQNFKQASMAYQNFKDTGKMPTEASAQRSASYLVNFKNIQDLLDKYNGDIAAIKKELLKVSSISDLNKERKGQGLEKLKTSWPAGFKVPLAASIFGPKLGMFYANLSGMENYPTLDRWWSRTFNRYRGTLIPQITRGFNKKGEALGIDRYKQIAGLENASEDEIIAKIIQDHDTYEDKGFKKGTDAEKAANTLYKKLFIELNDAPFGAKDREFMYDTFVDAKKKLKTSGINVTIADIQAILWYFEKNLYKKLGVTKPIQGISYEDAALKTFDKWSKAGGSFDYNIEKAEEGDTIEEIDEMSEDVADQASVGNRGQLLAPNGKPSNLTEQQYNQVRTPEFKNWFGDWENDPANASKVVDENGEPKVVYHGTESNIDEFKNLNRNITGFYFSNDYDNAKTYGPNIENVFLNIKNPLRVDANGLKFTDELPITVLAKYPNEKPYIADAKLPVDDVVSLVKNGDRQFWEVPNREQYDGVIFEGLVDPLLSTRRDIPQDTLVAFNPNQIKSATANVGTFSTTDNRIQASVGNREIINGFYSPIEDRINTFKQPKASVQKWKEIVGVKSDEAVFSGMSDWLGGKKPDQQLSKEEVLQFMKDNRIEINEVMKGDEKFSLSDEKLKEMDALLEEEGLLEFDTIEQVRGQIREEEDFAKNWKVQNPRLVDLINEYRNSVSDFRKVATKFSQYQLPGGENYKEVLITLPNKTDDTYTIEKRGEQLYVVVDKYDADASSYMKTEEEARKFIDYLNSDNRKRGVTKFSSSHFTEANIITHLRMNTRTDADGKKVLFLEEVQSDWGQTGKREGFGEATPASSLKAVSDYNMIVNEKNELLRQAADYVTSGRIPELQSKVDEIDNRLEDAKSKLPDNAVINFDSGLADIPVRKSIPSAPFVTNTNAWVKLGLKVALKEAVRQGADRIAWTTGDQQNERYDLSKSIKRIDFIRIGQNRYRFEALDLNNKRVAYDDNGTTSIEEIENMFGKDIADKVRSDKAGDLRVEGEGLKVGGKGMKAFYGDANNTGIVGNVAKALVKELTGKDAPISVSKIKILDKVPEGTTVADIYEAGGMEEFKKTLEKTSSQPAIDITPELSYAVTGGMPQFSVGNRSEEDLRAEGTGKERPRALASKYGNLNPATQAKIEDDATVYFQRTNKQTKEAVDKFLDGLNIMDAADYVLSNPKIPEVSQVWMAAEVAKRLNAEIDAAKDQDLIDDLTRKQADIFNEFAKRATSLGQAVQAFIAFKDNANAVEFFLPKVLRQLKKAGVENVTEEQRADILTLLKDVNTAAEGLPKDKAIIKLSHYLAGIAPLKPMDVLQAIWYAKILSGITTQSTNFFANIFNTVFELPAVALRISLMNGTPLGLAAGVKGFGSGVAKGAVAAADIIKSGVRSKEVDKYFAENPLEYFTWSKWLGNKGKALDYIPPLNFGAWKYIGRILAATDALFSTANQEAIANMLAYAEAAGTPAGNNFKKANAILGNNKMSVLRARAQAKAEGFEPGTIQYKRRELEIIAQKRAGTQEADEIGKRITMNYDPEGFTKPLFDAVVGLQKDIPAIKMVIPFARIVANLTENGLNYSPFGFAKAATGIKNPFQGLKSERLSTEQRVDLFAKFAIGMSTLAVLAANVGEDDDDWFEITAGGSTDLQKKYELQKGGWRPYTITLKDGTKINYKDWPVAGLLAGLGHVRDTKKYGVDDSTQTTLYATGFFLNLYDKSLLKGLQDLFGIVPKFNRGSYAPDDRMGERFTKYAAQQVKSVALSNLSQQSFKLYSELVTGDPQRDAKTFAQVIYRDIPSLNDGIRPIIDVFGDEVKYTTTERLLPVMASPEKEEIIEWLNNNKLFVGVPMKKNIKLLDGTERPMTDAEYYEYRKNAGKGVKKFINEFLAEIKDKEIGEEAFEKVVSAARQEAYAEILMKANNL